MPKRKVRVIIENPRRPRTEVRTNLPKFTTFGGKGLRAGVNLDNSAALLDVIERH